MGVKRLGYKSGERRRENELRNDSKMPSSSNHVGNRIFGEFWGVSKSEF